MKDTHIAHIAYEANRAYCQTLGDESQKPWADVAEGQRASTVTHVHGIVSGKPEQSYELQPEPEQQAKDEIFNAVVRACMRLPRKLTRSVEQSK